VIVMSKPVRPYQVDRIVRAGQEAATTVEQAIEADHRANRAIAAWLRVSGNSSPAEVDEAWERLTGAKPAHQADD
jgi:hypothetical protein